MGLRRRVIRAEEEAVGRKSAVGNSRGRPTLGLHREQEGTISREPDLGNLRVKDLRIRTRARAHRLEGRRRRPHRPTERRTRRRKSQGARLCSGIWRATRWTGPRLLLGRLRPSPTGRPTRPTHRRRRPCLPPEHRCRHHLRQRTRTAAATRIPTATPTITITSLPLLKARTTR